MWPKLNGGVRARKEHLQFALFGRNSLDVYRYRSGHQEDPRRRAELEEVHRGDRRPDRQRERRADRVTGAALRAIPASPGAGSELRWVGRSWGFTWVVSPCSAVAGGRRSTVLQ